MRAVEIAAATGSVLCEHEARLDAAGLVDAVGRAAARHAPAAAAEPPIGAQQPSRGR